MSIKAASKYVGLSETTLRRMVAERRLPYSKIGGRIVLLTKDMQRLLATYRVEAIGRAWEMQ